LVRLAGLLSANHPLVTRSLTRRRPAPFPDPARTTGQNNHLNHNNYIHYHPLNQRSFLTTLTLATVTGGVSLSGLAARAAETTVEKP
jgi:hypothetical protein